MTAKQLAPSGEQRSAIGDKGELWLAARLPQGWIWQPPRKDVGKDGLIVIRDESELHNLEFSVQVKATLKPRFSGEALVFSNVSRSSVLYWMASAYPTLVVAVDLSNDRAWYVWHFDLFKSVADIPKSTGTSISLRIPTSNRLTPEAWTGIRIEINRCYNYLYNSLSKGDSYVWIVASTGTVCNGARNLLKISELPLPGPNISKEDGITILIEQQQHRNVLVVASRLLGGLDPVSQLYRDVRGWKERYESSVRDAFPRLGQVPSKITNQYGREVAFNPAALSSSRRELIFMIFDLVTLITQIHPSGSHNAA